jgi:YfiH family protein
MITVDLPDAVAAFSTREGGVSEGPFASLNLALNVDDDTARVLENREILAREVGLGSGVIASGNQVHGVAIERWGAEPDPESHGFTNPNARRPDVDGHTTTRHGLGLLVQVADCLPVALASRQRVAMLHCGWRGLAGGIIEHALTLFEAPPVAVVGPGIGRCCYEVGPEVLAAFDEIDGAAEGQMLDLRHVAAAKLAGVERIEHVDMCTCCNADAFFSYRRDGGRTGRQCGIVWRP